MPNDVQVAPENEPDFITEETFLERVPICRGTAVNWRKTGKLPFVKVGSKKILYHWPSVSAALLRLQRGGVQ
jgi:predicted site-specific integrase-resolvase